MPIPINSENIQAQMRKGLLEFCILFVVSKKKVYASDILKVLKEANLLVVEGTLYPLLSRLKNGELLEYCWVESASGPPRKYYVLTSKGRQALEALRQTWEKLSQSVFHLFKNL